MDNGVLALGIAATLTPMERRVLMEQIRALSGPAAPGVKLGKALIPSGATISDIVAVSNAVQLLALGRMAQGMSGSALDEMNQSLITGNPVITTPERAKEVGLSVSPQLMDALASVSKHPDPTLAQGAMDVMVNSVLGEDQSVSPTAYEGSPDEHLEYLSFGDVWEGGDFQEGGVFKKKDGTKRKLFSGKLIKGAAAIAQKAVAASPLAMAVGMGKNLIAPKTSASKPTPLPSPQAAFSGRVPDFPNIPDYRPGRVPAPVPTAAESVATTTARLKADITKMVAMMRAAEADLKDQAMEFADIKRNYARVQTASAALIMPDQMANLVSMYPIEMTSLDALTLSVLPYVQASGNESVSDWWRNFATTFKSAISAGKMNVEAASDPMKMAGTFMKPLVTGSPDSLKGRSSGIAHYVANGSRMGQISAPTAERPSEGSVQSEESAEGDAADALIKALD